MASIDTIVDEVVAKVRSTFQAAYDSMKLSPDFLFFSWTSSGDYAAETNRKTMEKIGAQIDRWASIYRGWAAAGARDDGSSYTWRRWFDYGLDLAKQALSVAGGAWEDSSWEAARRQLMPTELVSASYKWVSDIGERVSQCIKNPKECNVEIPWWVWAGGLGVVALLILTGRR